MKIQNRYYIQHILTFGILLLFSFKLVGQEIIDGYKNGRQIIGTKVERNLLGETEWIDKDSSTYVYDEQQRLIKKEGLYFNDTTWVINERILSEYDTESQDFIYTTQRWSAGKLIEHKDKVTQEFNEQNQLVNRIVSDWINEHWINFSRTNYQYDESGNIINIGFSRFVNDEWKLIREETMAFDDLGNQISRIYRQINLAGIVVGESGYRTEKDTIDNQTVTDFWELYDGELLINTRKINFFSQENLLDSTFVLSLRWGLDTLKLNYKNVYEYNLTNQLIQNTIFDLKNNNWQPFYQINSEYDNNGHLIVENTFLWSEEEQFWVAYLVGQREWTYSENGILLKTVDYAGWIIEYEPWTAYDRNITYYANPLSVSINTISEDYSLQVFPNPVHNFLQIKTQGIIEFPLQISITNLQGQVLKQQKMSNGLMSIQLDGLPKGIYFIQFQDRIGRIKVEKIIKQ